MAYTYNLHEPPNVTTSQTRDPRMTGGGYFHYSGIPTVSSVDSHAQHNGDRGPSSVRPPPCPPVYTPHPSAAAFSEESYDSMLHCSDRCWSVDPQVRVPRGAGLYPGSSEASRPYTIPGLPPFPKIWEMPSAASIPSFNAPVHRLPPELLSHVFLQSLPEQLFEARLSRRSRPLVISHVCGYWRDVSLNMPELWRCISLTSCASRYEHHSRKLARLYVRRTKGLDLSIHYSDVEAATTITNPLETTFLQRGVRMLPEEDRCYCALDLVIKHVARLRLFEAVVGNSSAARLSSISPLSASALQRLQVEFLQEGDHTRYLSTLVMTSPRLRWLHWTSHMGVCTISPPAEAAWSQLVEAFLGKCTITHDALLNILAVGQCLKEVTVSISRGTHASEPPRERFRQAVLEQLYIHGSEPLDEVLGALQLPALRSFSLRSKSRDLQHWPCRDTRVLRNFIASVQALDVLELTPSGSLHEGSLIDILSLPPSSSLTELYVELPMITDDLISRLQPSAKSGIPLLPHLRKLSLGECITTDGVVARMLRARCKYCYPLRNAQISFRRCDNDKHPVDDVELRRLDQFGMFARGFY